ncbi:hypothetical protein C6N75_27535 [Streptomyces solincola]|uniref:Uncharacterized protein n=1 Tax=Streptomyces solincola TaxID=2100817 RepID=A0A2S9PNU2_9ACTN|nr:hypothetical protein [Streptomyces solincola]PRH76079.1 hypothetical protein C6N75_27535 [Streptomyces solincola]
MPDDVGGRPFPDGWEPDDDRGGADQDFASVVFDEDFVRAAAFHEPSAVERLVAAAQARAEAEAARGLGDRGPDAIGYGGYDGSGDDYGSYGDAYADEYGDGPYGAHGGALRPYRPSSRWHRPVAWLLAVVMGIGMVALAFSAVYRGSSAGRGEQVPAPSRTGVDGRAPGAPAVLGPPADQAVPAAPGTP